MKRFKRRIAAVNKITALNRTRRSGTQTYRLYSLVSTETEIPINPKEKSRNINTINIRQTGLESYHGMSAFRKTGFLSKAMDIKYGMMVLQKVRFYSLRDYFPAR